MSHDSRHHFQGQKVNLQGQGYIVAASHTACKFCIIHHCLVHRCFPKLDRWLNSWRVLNWPGDELTLWQVDHKPFCRLVSLVTAVPSAVPLPRLVLGCPLHRLFIQFYDTLLERYPTCNKNIASEIPMAPYLSAWPLAPENQGSGQLVTRSTRQSSQSIFCDKLT